jgi:hypothetical protein
MPQQHRVQGLDQSQQPLRKQSKLESVLLFQWAIDTGEKSLFCLPSLNVQGISMPP